MISRNWKLATAGTAVAGLTVATLTGLGSQSPGNAADPIDLTSRTGQVMSSEARSPDPLTLDATDSPDSGPNSPSSPGTGNSPDSPGDSPDSDDGARQVRAPVAEPDSPDSP
ncbi:MAG: hypothetical protein GEU78_20290, partial [Actinobacteria bacterium]|nr:hypothetical protein [Actinomycetota bacterium]